MSKDKLLEMEGNCDYEEVYTEEELRAIQAEFRRLTNEHYLDHAGSTLYAKSHIETYTSSLLGNVWGNPHSRNPSSTCTTDAIDSIRQRILTHFGTRDEDYAVIFTSGATSALKILAQSFIFNGGPFAYLEESHTSVVGMREVVGDSGGVGPCGIYAVPAHVMAHCLLTGTTPETNHGKWNCGDDKGGDETRNGLVAFPAQCNFSGYKYPLNWIGEIQGGGLASLITPQYEINQSETSGGEDEPIRWFVLLDAAAFVSTNNLDLSKFKADFITISFYKMFGFPTGLGALLVRKVSGSVLRKRYSGGGTVQVLIPSTSFHVPRAELHERFEDGTCPFLSILSLGSGFDTWLRLGGSLEKMSKRTFRLTQYAYRTLLAMRHWNGQPVARIYSPTPFDSPATSGHILTFNLVGADGDFIGYSQVEEIAFLHRIHLRFGCFCNPGACRRFLGYETQDLLSHFAAGHVCGDMRDMVDGQPTGAVRLSVGYMTSREDVDFFLDLVRRTWILSQNPEVQETHLGRPDLLNRTQSPTLQKIFIYPVKSCGPYEVKSGSWELSERGLSYDREWLIMNSMGIPLTQKREPRLVNILPWLDLSNRRLVLSCAGYPSMSLSLEMSPNENGSPHMICNSKVCGESVRGIKCGSEVSDWLELILDSPGLTLIRILHKAERREKVSGQGLSLANDSQYLLVSSGSLAQLTLDMESRGVSLQDSSSSSDEDDGEVDRYNRQRKQTRRSLMRRFRPNLVVRGRISAYEEETWDRIQIGPITFKSGGPCRRCGTICTDQKTGQRSSEPLISLGLRTGGKPTFGIHLSKVPSSSSSVQSLTVGDHLRILSLRSPSSSNMVSGHGHGSIRDSVQPEVKLKSHQLLIESID